MFLTRSLVVVVVVVIFSFTQVGDAVRKTIASGFIRREELFLQTKFVFPREHGGDADNKLEDSVDAQVNYLFMFYNLRKYISRN